VVKIIRGTKAAQELSAAIRLWQLLRALDGVAAGGAELFDPGDVRAGRDVRFWGWII
jgi:hypothetical protein